MTGRASVDVVGVRQVGASDVVVDVVVVCCRFAFGRSLVPSVVIKDVVLHHDVVNFLQIQTVRVPLRRPAIRVEELVAAKHKIIRQIVAGVDHRPAALEEVEDAILHVEISVRCASCCISPLETPAARSLLDKINIIWVARVRVTVDAYDGDETAPARIAAPCLEDAELQKRSNLRRTVAVNQHRFGLGSAAERPGGVD